MTRREWSLAATALWSGWTCAPRHAEAESVPQPPVTALAAAPDGRQLVAASQRGVVVWSLPDLTEVAAIAPPPNATHLHDLLFLDARTLLVAGGEPGERGGVWWLDWPTGEVRRSVPLGEDIIDSLATAGEWVAAVGAPRSVWLLERAGTGAPRLLAGHSKEVLDTAFVGESLLVTGGRDFTLRCWDVRQGRPVRALTNHTGEVTGLAARPGVAAGPPQLASVGADRTVRIWQPTIGRLVRFARLPADPTDVAWSPDGSKLLVPCVDGVLRIVDPLAVTVEEAPGRLDGRAYCVAATAGGTYLGGFGGVRAADRP